MPRLRFFIDGAHTPESMYRCTEWFSTVSRKESNASVPFRILLFSCGADRKPQTLFPSLRELGVDAAIFCEMESFKSSLSAELKDTKKGDQPGGWYEIMAKEWLALQGNTQSAQNVAHLLADDRMSIQKSIRQHALIAHNLKDALSFIGDVAGSNPIRETHVLVTGSLLFSGDVLRHLKLSFDVI